MKRDKHNISKFNFYIKDLESLRERCVDNFEIAKRREDETTRKWQMYCYGEDLAFQNLNIYLCKTYGVDIVDYIKLLVKKIGNLLITDWDVLEEGRTNVLANRAPTKKNTATLCINNDLNLCDNKNLNTFYVPGGYYIEPKYRNTEFVGDDGKICIERKHFNDSDKYFDENISKKIKSILEEFYTFPRQRDWYILRKKYESRTPEGYTIVDGEKFLEEDMVKRWIY